MELYTIINMPPSYEKLTDIPWEHEPGHKGNQVKNAKLILKLKAESKKSF